MKQKLEQYSYAAKKKKQIKIISTILTLILVFLVLHFTMKFLIYPVSQSSVSMQPDVPEKSLIMVTPLPLRLQRGDVVLVKPRAKIELTFGAKLRNLFVSFFTAHKVNLECKNDQPGTQNELRRVIGLPGDTIYMRDYVMYIKPEGEKHFLTEFELTKKKYNVNFSVAPADWDSTIGVLGFSDEIVLGEDEYYVIGDNRKSSTDSRLWGSVSRSDIEGKALFCYFPFNKIKHY